MSKFTPAEKLAAAIDRAGFAPRSDEEQRDAALNRLTNAISLYLWKSGRDPDTPEGVRRLVAEAPRTLRALGKLCTGAAARAI